MTSYEKDENRYEYTYNADGLRISKKIYDNGALSQTHSYVWTDGVLVGTKVHFVSSNSDSYIRYIYNENGEAVGMTFDNFTFLFIKNVQGDVVSLVKAETDELCVNLTYDAWGKVSIHPTSQNIGAIIGAVLVTALNNFTYRGYFTDYDTGLYYLQSRYYDPEIGRFINADDTSYLGFDTTPNSFNLFDYCKNNPVNYVDPNGLYSQYSGIIVNIYDGNLGHADITIDGYTYSYGVYTNNVSMISRIRGTAPGYFVGADAMGWELNDNNKFNRKIIHIKLYLSYENEMKIAKWYFGFLGNLDFYNYQHIVYNKYSWDIFRVKYGKYKNYSLLKVNCTTMVVEALSKALDPNILKITERIKGYKFSSIIKPNTLNSFLQKYVYILNSAIGGGGSW